jgi:hypothetical protein
MPSDMTPVDLPAEGEPASPDTVHQGLSLRPVLIIAAVMLLSLWLVGETWAHTISAAGGCGGG